MLVLTAMTFGGYAGVVVITGLVDGSSFLSSVIPGDGRNAVVVGGIGGGGLLGMVLPLILFAAVRGTEEKPRTRLGEALLKVAAALVFSVYLLAVSLLAAQLG